MKSGAFGSRTFTIRESPGHPGCRIWIARAAPGNDDKKEAAIAIVTASARPNIDISLEKAYNHILLFDR